MDKFLLELLGTNNIAMICAGFVWALLSLIFTFLMKKQKPTINVFVYRIIGILIFMRFYAFMFEIFDIQITNISTALVGLIAGFIGELSTEKLYEHLKNLFKNE